jgi:hypothetical protein
MLHFPHFSHRWLHWEERFPSVIKGRLHQLWPDAKLYLEGLSVGLQTHVDEVQIIDLNLLKSLVDFHNIHSIQVVIEYEHPIAMRWLKNVLLGSPNLRILHLTLPRTRDGKVDWLADGHGTYDLCVQPGERLSPLTELVFETRKPLEDDRSIIPSSFFDFTQMHRLELRGFNMDRFLLPLASQLLRLQSLTILYFNKPLEERGNVLEKFVSSIRGVRTLRIIISVRLPPISTFFVFAGTLNTLELRFARQAYDSYTFSRGVERTSYTPDDLDALREACPQISSLILDMIMVNTLVSFRSNSSLKIHLIETQY